MTACFCGDPDRPGVGHRSHECVPIGPQPRLTATRAPGPVQLALQPTGGRTLARAAFGETGREALGG